MKNTKRIISFLLVLCTVLTAILAVTPIATYADTTETEVEDLEAILNTYLSKEFNTPEEKLASMTKRLTKDGYELYVDSYTGEVATKNMLTGEILFTNPYDVATEGSVSSATSTIPKLLSQIIISYSDSTGEGIKTMNSFTDAAKRGQIIVKNIKNGIRVEYTIGRTETKYLVPRRITAERFEELIKAPLQEAVDNGLLDKWTFKKWIGDGLTGFYQLQDPSKKSSVTTLYPITAEIGAIYTFDENTATAKELTKVEELIKAFCPEYSYEELEKDHTQCEYVAKDKNPPVFKMALEYTLDESGVSVTLPASGIRFNQSIYTLENITILPYMGCGAYSKYTPNDGYIFFPDGSGTLFDYAKLKDDSSNLSIGGMVYGTDYAYQTLSGTSYEEMIRYPVYGIAEKQYKADVEDGEIKSVSEGTSRGFVAIITEGDSMAELIASSGGSTHKYYNVEMRVYPRPKDTYVLSDAVSVGSNNEWTVTSSRKYTGNYTIKYIMLTDDEVASEAKMSSYYTTDWVGMATAYRDYLVNSEILKKLTDSDVQQDIPLYIESFGAIETTEKILAFPVTVMTPLTTFEDVKEMYGTLSNLGIKNVNFKLTGFANGGMYSTVPYALKWEKNVGGSSGFKDLIEYAAEVNSNEGSHLGLYPDFDFAYVKNTGLFDGYSSKDHAIKTIDNRYTSKRYYSETKQTYITYYELAISASTFDHFYEKLTKNYVKYSLNGNGSDLGISVASIGTDLNSDFDEDEPYNREDSKEYTIKAFEFFDDNYGSVMTSGANAYTWKYVDHILNTPMTSSRYFKSATTVPFLGTVLHGYVQYTGSPINMEGNVNYAILKAIESGSSVYFTLSYRNTEVLKEDEMLSQYYSTRYNIWVGEVNDDGIFEQGELVSVYNKLNKALQSVQTCNIIGHEFLNGVRIASDSEKALDLEDKQEKIKKAVEEYNNEVAKETKEYRGKAFTITTHELNSLKAISTSVASNAKNTLNTAFNSFKNGESNVNAFKNAITSYESATENVLDAYKTAVGVVNAYNLVNENASNYNAEIVSDLASKKVIADQIIALFEEYFNAFEDANDYSLNYIDTESIPSKYLVKDYSIVKVVYGEGTTAKKTFILNYNYFDVEVEFNGETIKIEAYGFVER